MVDLGVSQRDVQSMYAAYNLFSNWDRMSPAQKSRSVVALGLSGYEFTTGKDFAKEFIIDPATHGGEGLTFGQAFNLFSQGYNVYSLTKNWKDLNNVQRVLGGGRLALDVVNTAKGFNMLGFGTNGAAVSNVTAASLSQAGWKTASNYGIGAITAPAGTKLPAGYSLVSQGSEGVIAAPTANVPSTSYLQGAGGALTFAAGAYQLYQGWGAGGARGRANGAIGGAAMAGGLYAMSGSGILGAGGVAAAAANPFVLGGVVALSVLGNSIKTGKSGDQESREAVLGFLKEKGYVGDQNTVTLPDGTVVDLGIDGHGGLHSAANPDKLTKEHLNEGRAGRNKLNYWDTDYTNDLDFFAGMGGTSLVELLAGGKNKPVSHLGGKIGNGALQNIGYGAEFTPENYAKLQQNLRAIYSQMGVKSKEDGFQLANQLFAEQRVSDADAVRIQQSLNFVFDDGNYESARQLFTQGRFQGIQVASEDKDTEPDTTVDVGGQSVDPGRLPGAALKNPPAQLQPGKNTFDNPPLSVVGPKPVTAQPAQPMQQGQATTSLSTPQPAQARQPMMSRTKDEIKAANRLLYVRPEAMQGGV